MPGFLPHSPQRIIAAYFVGIDLASDPDVSPLDPNGFPSDPWPIYSSREPDRPDEIIRIIGTVGRSFGYTQPDSERQEMNGIQIMVRSTDDNLAWTRLQHLALSLDNINQLMIRLPLPTDSPLTTGTGTDGSILYQVHSVYRTTEPTFIGRDTPQGKRVLYSVNALASIRHCY